MDIERVRDQLRATVGPKYVPDRDAAFSIIKGYLSELLADFDRWIHPHLQRELIIIESAGILSCGYATYSEEDDRIKTKLREGRYAFECSLYDLLQNGDNEQVNKNIAAQKEFLQRRYGRPISCLAELEILVDAVDSKIKMIDAYERAEDSMSFVQDITRRSWQETTPHKEDAHTAQLWREHDLRYHQESTIAYFLHVARSVYEFEDVVREKDSFNNNEELKLEEQIAYMKRMYMDHPYNGFPDICSPVYELRHLIYFDSVFRRAQKGPLSFEEALYIYNSDGWGFGIEQIIDMQAIQRDMDDETIQLANEWREEIPDSIREIVHDSITENYRQNPKHPGIAAFLEKASQHFTALQRRDGKKIRCDVDRHIASIIYLMTRGQYYDQFSDAGKDCDGVVDELKRAGYTGTT